MKFRMDEPLRFWIDCSYEDQKYENAKCTRAELIVENLRESNLHHLHVNPASVHSCTLKIVVPDV